MKTAISTLLVTLLLISCSDKKNTTNSLATWQHYLGDPERSHYSTLSKIDTTNVSELQLAWTYNSGGLEMGRTTQIQTNPLIVAETLYGVNPAIELFALDAETGKELWKYVPSDKDNTGLGLNRGLSYWESNTSEEDSRLFFASGFRLYAVSAKTGKAIADFGENGSVDLRDGLGRDKEKMAVYANTCLLYTSDAADD